ncbi:hypothetical protein DFS34DRAFT_610985 [Phlyctochytrium arcticum]|nr:hypothetical protein DFS34DRAFT_610985 [Phlyctochytrium arcticum]
MEVGCIFVGGGKCLMYTRHSLFLGCSQSAVVASEICCCKSCLRGSDTSFPQLYNMASFGCAAWEPLARLLHLSNNGICGWILGITSQSFTFLFILERYMSLVHRFTVNNWQAKQMVLSVYFSGLFISATPFMFGRRSSVAPSGLYYQPIWSNGGDWVGFYLGILALMFVSANLIGAAVMYLRIYQKFVRVSRQAERAVEGGGTTLDTNTNGKPTTSDEVSVKCVPTKSILAFKKGCAAELHQQSTAIAYALAKQAFTYYLVHAICNTPLAYEFLHHVVFQLPPPAWYDLLVYMATFLFTITNFILLVFLNQHYRMAAWEEWRDWKNRVQKLSSRGIRG